MDADHARALLERERQRVEKALAGLRSEPHLQLSDYDQHPADEGTETFEQERDEGIAEQLEQELAAIERAERRVEEGTFGRSIESGEPIPDARLEAIPWAERIQEEQARLGPAR